MVRWFGTNTDITEQIEAAAERERLLARERDARGEADRRREELERVTESRTRLIRGFSHDLKNPLGAADGHAQLREDGILGDLSGKQRESVHRIRRSIQASLQLIGDLLELARAEAGQIELQCEATDVDRTARDVVEDFRAQAAAAGLEVEIPVGKQDQIFQEFTRLDPAAQTGACVGLAISRRIARLLGGDLTVQSELGHGSTFTLWLPAIASRRTAV